MKKTGSEVRTDTGEGVRIITPEEARKKTGSMVSATPSATPSAQPGGCTCGCTGDKDGSTKDGEG